jgi:5-methylcytosine-specific restriction endonuclease McrA
MNVSQNKSEVGSTAQAARDLKNLSSEELIQKLEKLTDTERKVTHVILLHIQEVEARKLYAKLGFESMFAYLVNGLHYSESAAYRRLQSARLLTAIPNVAEKLESGSLNLSQLTQVQKCVKLEKKKGVPVPTEKVQQVLKTLENKTSFESEKILAKEFNFETKSEEVIKPQSDGTIYVSFAFTSEEFEEIKQAQSFLSHSCPDNNLGKAMALLARKFNQAKRGKNEKLSDHSHLSDKSKSSAKASSLKNSVQNENQSKSHTKIGSQNRSNTQTNQPTQSNTEAEVSAKTKFRRKNGRRPYISVKIKRLFLRRANYCCEFQDPTSHRKCTSKYQLQTDHRIPLALGGKHEFSNFRILCRTHNLYEAERMGLTH